MPNRPTLSQVGPINQSYWKNYVLEGWCDAWVRENGSGRGRRIPTLGATFGEHLSRDTCYQACMDDDACNQAIYESDGPTGTKCWFGTNVMNIDTERPENFFPETHNRAGTLKHR